MTAISDEQRISVPKNVVSKEVGGDLVLLDVNGGTYYKLNHSALAFWKRMSDGITFGECLGQLGETFDVPPEKLREEMSALLTDLLKEKLAEALP